MKKRILSLMMALGMCLSVGISAFAADTNSVNKAKSKTADSTQIIGEYNGVVHKTGISTDSVATVRINSYATYSKSDGIKVHIKLYVPWYEFANPKFTSMEGMVAVDMNKKTTNTSFVETANEESTISTDVSTGVKGSSGDKGTVTVTGTATAVNALSQHGGFHISYAVKLP